MADSIGRSPWLRAELALAAGRGALMGALAWDLFEILTGKLSLSGGEWAIQWIPPLLILAAGSPRVLAWVRAQAASRMAIATAPAAAGGQRVYLGLFSGRALATLAMLGVLLLVSRGREDWVWDSVADDAGFLLIPAALTWAWTSAGPPGRRWKLAAAVGAIAGAAWEAITITYFSSQIANVLEQAGIGTPVMTVRNLLPGALTWAVLGIAGTFAVERRFAATTALAPRLAVALGASAFALQLVEAVTKLGTIYIGGQVDVANAAAGVVSGPELFSLAFMAIGWALAAARAPGAAVLLRPAAPETQLHGSSAATAAD